MTTPSVPKLSVPFQWVGGRVQVVEQDSQANIDQCVDTVLRTPEGARPEKPEFGVVDVRFGHGHGTSDKVREAIQRWEPRAVVDVDADPSVLVDREDRTVVTSREATRAQ